MSSPATQESYVRLGRRWRRARGFRLCARNRFSVRRLRAKLLTLLGLVGRYARLLVRRLSTSGSFPRSGSTRTLVRESKHGGLQYGQRWCRPAAEAANKVPRGTAEAASFMRTNSFYAQAIAECLEFIKRNSVPVEGYGGGGVVGTGR